MANRYWVGGSGTWNALNTANWSATSGGAGGASVPTIADTAFLDAASGAAVVTLGENVSVLRLVLGNVFTGTLAFNGFKIIIVGNNATVFSGSFVGSVTGTPVVDLTYAGATGTRTITTYATTEAGSFNFNVTAGSDIIASALRAKNLNFTGFSGSFAIGTLTKIIYGSLTLSTGMSVTGGTGELVFGATSGTVTHTFNGKTLDCPVEFNAPGSTQVLSDALIVGATRTLTLTAGTIKFKSGATSSAGTFAIAGSSSPAVSLNATTSGSNATISQTTGTVNASNSIITDIAAAGGATWNAFAANNNVDAGNNSGWNFGLTPQYAYEYPLELRSFTERKRF
jgi:hypothetical protein